MKAIHSVTTTILVLSAAVAGASAGCVGDLQGVSPDSGAGDDSSVDSGPAVDGSQAVDGDHQVDSQAVDGSQAVDSGSLPDSTTSDVGPSDTDASDVGPPGWTPASLGAGLVAWLDGSRGVSTNSVGVTSWADQSPNGNSAAPGPCAQPTYGAKVAPNGHGAVGFNGSTQCLLIPDATTLQWGTDDFIVEAVVAYSNPASQSEWNGYAGVWEKSSGASPFAGIGLTVNGVYPKVQASVAAAVEASGWVSDPQNVAVEGATLGINGGAYHIVGVRRVTATTTLEVRLDGAPDGKISTLDPVNVSALGVGVAIGGRTGSGTANANHALQGYVAEEVAYHGTISNVQLAQLELYLAQKYGLP